MICPVCGNEDATMDAFLGVLPGPACQQRQKKLMFNRQGEDLMTQQRLSKDRREHAASLVQPWRNGEPSLEFQELYPKQAKKLFAHETKTPKYVYGRGGSLKDLW